MAKTNLIAERLDRLSEQYSEFAEHPTARVLCWRLQDFEERMVDAFLALEAEGEGRAQPDLFLQLSTAFEDERTYGFQLAQEVVAQHERSRAALVAEGLEATWKAPSSSRGAGGPRCLIETCTSLAQHYEVDRHLTLVLRPATVKDARGFQLWMQRLIYDAPIYLRIIVLEPVATPILAELAAVEPKHVFVRTPDLHMREAIDALCERSAEPSEPGHHFRATILRLSRALEGGDIASARMHAESALAVAHSQRWFHLAVPVHFAMGAALTGAERPTDAVDQYVAAEQVALEGASHGAAEMQSTCTSMRLQARLGCGSALISAGQYRLAADHFEETARLALAAQDAQTGLESYRLASYCHEQTGDHERAFETGLAGLKVANEGGAELVESSGFSYLGVGLLRTCAQGSRRAVAAQLEREIALVAGTADWRPAQENTAPERAPPSHPGAPTSNAE